MTTGAQQIRDAVAADTVLMPGVYDALTARIAARVGFDVVFISGYSVSAARLGEPDFGFLTQTDMVEAARAVCRVSDAPVIVDADTGYGNAVNVLRAVRDLQDAGAAGVFLEDQVWPKKCGHMAGKRVVDTAEHAAKIRAAVDARGDRDLFVVARTDARQPLGVEEAIERCLAYKEAGADALFVEAPQSVDELARSPRRSPHRSSRTWSSAGSRRTCRGPSCATWGSRCRLPARGALRGHASGDRRPHRAPRQGDDVRRLRPDGHVRRVQRPRRPRRALRGRGALRLLSDHAGRQTERGTEESNLELGFWRPTCYHYTSPPSGGDCSQCGRRDSNPQGLSAHRHLKPARLPVPPRPRAQQLLRPRLR